MNNAVVLHLIAQTDPISAQLLAYQLEAEHLWKETGDQEYLNLAIQYAEWGEDHYWEAHGHEYVD